MTKSIWDYAEEEAAQRGEQARRDEENPILQARLKAKRDEEFARGVRLGWHDADGEPIPQADEDEDDEAEEADDE